MTRRTVRELTIVTYRVVEEVSDDEQPSLPPGPAAYDYTTTAEEVSQVRPGLAKCGALPASKRRTG